MKSMGENIERGNLAGQKLRSHDFKMSSKTKATVFAVHFIVYFTCFYDLTAKPNFIIMLMDDVSIYIHLIFNVSVFSSSVYQLLNRSHDELNQNALHLHSFGLL